ANLIGAELPEKEIDGLDIWPILSGEEGAENPHEAYWVYYKQNELQAVMSGDWKLVLPHTYRTLAGREGTSDGLPIKYENTKSGLELYDLAEDIGESNNLAESMPEKVEEMMKHVESARAELGDRLTDRTGSGSREPGRLTDEERLALEKKHWPDGKKKK
ncbi:MAG: hypothetical protein AAF491_08545, partial [Verrucomicrobiota bacterium]